MDKRKFEKHKQKKNNSELEHLILWNVFTHSKGFFTLKTDTAPKTENEAVLFPTYPVSKGHLFVTWGKKRITEVSFLHGL